MLKGRSIATAIGGVLAACVGARRLRANRTERANLARLPVGADGIIHGAGPIALDADSDRGVVLLHGFGDTPHTLRFLAAHLHGLGFTVRAPLLPGHGRTLPEFAKSDAEEWLAAATDALRSLRSCVPNVGVAGLSMGGALALLLASEQAPIPALVLMAPFLEMAAGVRRLARLHAGLGAAVGYLPVEDARSILNSEERSRSRGYGVVTLRLLHELDRITNRASRALPTVMSPTLVIQSRFDNRVTSDATTRAFNHLGSSTKRMEWTNAGGHVITVDTGREHVLELTGNWLTMYVTGRRT